MWTTLNRHNYRIWRSGPPKECPEYEGEFAV
jgi:hypothetical protein